MPGFGPNDTARDDSYLRVLSVHAYAPQDRPLDVMVLPITHIMVPFVAAPPQAFANVPNWMLAEVSLVNAH